MKSESFFARLRAPARREPALHGARGPLTYAALLEQVDALANDLSRQRVRTLATVLPNGPAWVIADLAALRAGIVHVPLPSFFTAAQIDFALDAAGADALLAKQLATGGSGRRIAGEACRFARRSVAPVSLSRGTGKITFTSGSTGTPKGVCLDAEAQLTVADGLAQALAPVSVRRHLCTLPLAVLLENIAGVYAPLLSGASVILPAAAEVGLEGATSFRPAALNAAAARYRADSVITLPQMLRAWSVWRQRVAAEPLSALKFVAVGGAQVGKALLAQARRAGLPAFEGYGLSEAASVQTLNLPHADRPGSAGKPLPHAKLRISHEGEVWVTGSLMLGYLGEPLQHRQVWLATGDLGMLDGEGFLHIQGRKRNVLITSFGRNVSPEWVETTLQAQGAIAHAAVFGEAQPLLWTVLWPAHPTTSDAELAAAVAVANAELPDYARVGHWVRAAQSFDAISGMATANGRPRREAIARMHAPAVAVDRQATSPHPKERHAIL